MKKRRYGREIALKILYQQDISGSPMDQIESKMYSEHTLTDGIKSFVHDIVEGTCQHMTEIDNLLSRLAIHWKINRMAVIDRNILRMASYEIIYHPETPVKVIINEAVEIAKKYGDDKSYQFINGVLDAAAREYRKETIETRMPVS